MSLPVDDLETRLFHETDSRPIVLYDGVCNLCNGAVNFVLDHDRMGQLRFAALQSNVGKALLELAGRRPDDISSIVLVTKGAKAYVKAEAVLRIGEIIQASVPIAGLSPVARALVPKPLADFAYDFVADNRYSFLGHSDQCRFSDEGFEDRFIKDL